MNKKLLTDIFLGLTLFVILVGSYLYSKNQKQFSPLDHEYVTTKGKTTFKSLISKEINLVYFGFLTCPEACPTTLNKIKSSLSDFTPEEREKFQFIFVGLDPERDSLEKIQTYLNFFDQSFIGVYSPLEALDPLTKQFGIVFQKIAQGNSAMSYTIDHSTDILVLDQSGKIIFTLHHDSPKIVLIKELKKLIELSKDKK